MTRRLLASYLSLTLVVLAMLEVPLGFVNARNERAILTAKVQADAVAVASLAESVVEREPTTSNLPALDRLARRYAAETGGRIVVVDARGVALVDPTPPEPGRRSFASRPEFRTALGGGVATGVRYSRTLGYRFLYVAVPIASGGVVRGAVRITYPTSDLERRERNYWLVLAGIAAIALAVAALTGLRFARWIRRPLEGLELAASQARGGDLGARAAVPDAPPEIRQLTLEFNEMVARLEGLVTAQKDFVADASHELRTPLTALRLRLENLERHVVGAGRSGVAAASAEVDRLSALVDSLLALAQIEAGGAPTEAVDLAAVARARIDAFQGALERGVRLQLAPVSGPVRARTGESRVGQVLDNLIANALRASPDAGTVTVAVGQSGRHAELAVRDEGPGMSPEQIARAFDRFWRGSSSGTGSGLGLAITLRLVELDGGTIQLGSAPGGGLEAVVRLPTA